ncbi:hypothetical protein PIB30_070813 [Stylosanthes scabra]|uniref:Reverse transcriptase domain-containing protein n=1 Tax=Stylosanthes scabra TaxID=79078 RepID=A0ABU6TQX0_9FABA|nr:hypothetical protein [Stylosanthes scabra]
MALVKGIREDTPFLKSLTKRPPKMVEKIQEISHDYLQQEEGQTAIRIDRNKKGNTQRDQFREEKRTQGAKAQQIGASPEGHKKCTHGDRSLYCKYHKQTGHDTKECRDLLEFVEQGLKNEKFCEYTNKYRQRDDDRRVSQRVNSSEGKADRKKDDPKERSVHREIAMITWGIPEEGNPHLRK